ncbi:MAG: bifunctional UDP-N-acetylglucosamine diphosphorylase/glucosamine-1-phosphate N-acetyltransferase GlmU [Nitrosomonas sp.]|uniref:bifunctional UDP-N-acetylglucosamine diphosphorylase/glucosamine-1-phosphate N-acetyltransferase GlmU n=1 Tax=Nitrosomonas sp. TaxID=42353 RepID=UPI0025FBB31B|nr:bifunctional UDP-N-acetylglucosamine diphosphorylase/glucosamine-1-phosphate N-acetyltransferase GlmU [Nitrosomonas sp.]MBY0474603.1 bifunctional UDP-N-acetylglucosamine diphosphorylase/glucosamine-1-phosphate N-acetyltransferase GlmU [Nitrosomonas sp.]
MLKLNVVILAAGAGKRMHSSLPKVLHTLAGRPLLTHVINTARKLSPNKICVVIGHGGETIRQTIIGDDLTWVIQEQQLGTGHALMQALSQLSDDGLTLILYGDVPLVSMQTLRQLLVVADGRNCAVLSTIIVNPFGYGRIVRDIETGAVTAIVEQKDASAEQQDIHEINTGIMLIPNVYLHKWLPTIKNENTQQEYYLTDLIEMAVKNGIHVASSQVESFWEVMGVNNKLQLAELERHFQKYCANKLLDEGVSLIDPLRIDIRGELICGADVEIDINCIFEGTVKLGNHVQVGAHCILRNATVATGSIIRPYSMMEDVEIGENCKIGPYARIRPGTRLASEVQIGNFVEVKNSQMGVGSKTNHLSYIGDSCVGKNVNIGAGTITCNYDGANKHATIIEDDVFIGSDTQLVAPVKISKGSTIGAGSTITKETPANQLTLSRSKQVSIVGWRRPPKIKK